MVAYKNKGFERNFTILSFSLPQRNNISCGVNLSQRGKFTNKTTIKFLYQQVCKHSSKRTSYMDFYQGVLYFSQRSFINNEDETYAFCGISYETSNRKNLNLCSVLNIKDLILEILAKVHIKELLSPKLHLTLKYDCAESKTISI